MNAPTSTSPNWIVTSSLNSGRSLLICTIKWTRAAMVMCRVMSCWDFYAQGKNFELINKPVNRWCHFGLLRWYHLPQLNPRSTMCTHVSVNKHAIYHRVLTQGQRKRSHPTRHWRLGERSIPYGRCRWQWRVERHRNFLHFAWFGAHANEASGKDDWRLGLWFAGWGRQRHIGQNQVQNFPYSH